MYTIFEIFKKYKHGDKIKKMCTNMQAYINERVYIDAFSVNTQTRAVSVGGWILPLVEI